MFCREKSQRAREEIFEDIFFPGERLNFPENLQIFGEKACFWRSLPICVLGPWPREVLSSEGLSLASDFFVSLALASNFVSSIPPFFGKTGRLHPLLAKLLIFEEANLQNYRFDFNKIKNIGFHV